MQIFDLPPNVGISPNCRQNSDVELSTIFKPDAEDIDDAPPPRCTDVNMSPAEEEDSGSSFTSESIWVLAAAI